MAKIIINDVNSGYDLVTSLNNRLQQIEDEFNNNVLYRSNPVLEANHFIATDLDLNNNDILNVKDIYSDRLFLNGIDMFQIIQNGKK